MKRSTINKLVGWFFLALAIGDMYLLAYLAHIWSRLEPWYAGPTYFLGVIGIIACVIVAITYFTESRFV